MNLNHIQRKYPASFLFFFFILPLSQSCPLSIQMPELLGNTVAAEELKPLKERWHCNDTCRFLDGEFSNASNLFENVAFHFNNPDETWHYLSYAHIILTQ